MRVIGEEISLLAFFLPAWKEEICGPRREFLPGFSSLIFSSFCQTVKNTIFHLIFLFLLVWKEKICGPGREFLPGFPSSIFFSLCQTVKNTVFHPIFLSLFFILSKFPLTKHSVSDPLLNACHCGTIQVNCATRSQGKIWLQRLLGFLSIIAWSILVKSSCPFS